MEKRRILIGNYNQTVLRQLRLWMMMRLQYLSINVVKNTDLNNMCSITSIAVPATSDNCGVQSVTNNFTGTNNASGTYPIGTTSVTYTVTDAQGNTTTCSFTVTVN